MRLSFDFYEMVSQRISITGHKENPLFLLINLSLSVDE
jgi:hypothetical protein